jgi:hypothetical protein
MSPVGSTVKFTAGTLLQRKINVRITTTRLFQIRHKK